LQWLQFSRQGRVHNYSGKFSGGCTGAGGGLGAGTGAGAGAGARVEYCQWSTAAGGGGHRYQWEASLLMRGEAPLPGGLPVGCNHVATVMHFSDVKEYDGCCLLKILTTTLFLVKTVQNDSSHLINAWRAAQVRRLYCRGWMLPRRSRLLNLSYYTGRWYYGWSCGDDGCCRCGHSGRL
jgi:hypothetical protein